MVGNAPKIFTRCNGYGTPVYAALAIAVFSLLAYLYASSISIVFNWFINLTNAAGFTSLIYCSIIFLRFRKACKAQNILSLPYQSKVHPYAAWACIPFFCMLLLLNGFSVFFPRNFTALSFLTAYIGFPIFFAIYTTHRIYARKEP